MMMVTIWLMMVNNNLVGGKTTPLKNDGVSNSWDDDIPYMKWKIKVMFQTTSQIYITNSDGPTRSLDQHHLRAWNCLQTMLTWNLCVKNIGLGFLVPH